MAALQPNVKGSFSSLKAWEGFDVATIVEPLNLLIDHAAKRDPMDGTLIVLRAAELLGRGSAMDWPSGLPEDWIYWARDRAGKMLASRRVFDRVQITTLEDL